MTKLEDKLRKLGYYHHPKEVCVWISKRVFKHLTVVLNIVVAQDKVINKYLTPNTEYAYIETQGELDDLQHAFDQLQKDLEEIKK